ncbi:MAG: hypothetical protein R3B07_15795 [Polyangiaceae bacterium]
MEGRTRPAENVRRAVKNFDFRQVLRAAYRLDLDDSSWLETLALAAEGGLPQGVALIAYTCKLSDEFAMELQTLTVARGDRAFLQIVPAVVSEMDGRDLRAWFGRGYATISETFRSPMPEESIRAYESPGSRGGLT